MAKTSFSLGGRVDASGDRTDELLSYDANDLTTHGVIVGMTGSGKTGLGIIYIEEAVRAGIPVLVLDPKGDMTNLLLTFPDLAPADFEPWVDEAEARRADQTVAELASATADLWRRGLAGWDLDGSDIAALRDAADFTIFTPGSGSGVPLNILGSLQAPDLDWSIDAESGRDEIEGLVSGLLALVGIEADPLSSREHILLSNLVERSWREEADLDLESLIAMIQRPPLRKLGVFEIDSFFPEKDRLDLAMRLNALVASPSFADWRRGPGLDAGSLLWNDDGKPQVSIIYLAHLSDEERQFVVTMVLGRLITWMRSQPGSSDLRALVYMDEVFGFVPPTAAPPAKRPILTILKQARAFGIGMILSTQNPVDLDYKAMSNAGTWSIGRLQTERDKARILEALQSASGDSDIAALDDLISGLGKRVFVLHNTRDPSPAVFTTRWAMSYLRGPLTRDQIAQLSESDPRRSAETPAADQPSADAVAADATTVVPAAAAGVPVRFADPGSPWLEVIGAEAHGQTMSPALAARVRLTFDDRYADVDHDEEWQAVWYPLRDELDPADAMAVDNDPRDFLAEPPAGSAFSIPDAPIDSKAWYSGIQKALKEHLHRSRTIEVLRNRKLKAYSRVGESRQEFAARCRRLADDEADREVAALKKKYEARIDRARDQIEAAREKVRNAQLDVESRRQEELLSGAGTVLGVLLGRRNSRSMSTAATKRSRTRKAERRLESAEDKVSDEVEDLDELEVDLAEEIAAITAEWDAVAEDIEPMEIGLEKSDIAIDDLTLVWIPAA